jgi:glycosyltransferase involved in cell wall biosynthesis
MEDQIRSWLQQTGMLERVHFAGQVAYQDLPAYYRSADLYLSASHSDGSSISLLEAQACGLPALVSDIPGNRQWVQPGEQGWRFPDGDVQALAQAIQAAVETPSLEAMGQAARAQAQAQADWKINQARMLAGYQQAVDFAQAGRAA